MFLGQKLYQQRPCPGTEINTVTIRLCVALVHTHAHTYNKQEIHNRHIIHSGMCIKIQDLLT